MHLGFGVFSSFFFLSQFNLYVVVLFLVLGMLIEKAKYGGPANVLSAYTTNKSSRES